MMLILYCMATKNNGSGRTCAIAATIYLEARLAAWLSAAATRARTRLLCLARRLAREGTKASPRCVYSIATMFIA